MSARDRQQTRCRLGAHARPLGTGGEHRQHGRRCRHLRSSQRACGGRGNVRARHVSGLRRGDRLYILGCLAAWRLARGGVALAGAALNFRWLTAAMLIGVTGMLTVIALASRAEILGLASLILVTAAIYLLQTRLVPAVT